MANLAEIRTTRALILQLVIQSLHKSQHFHYKTESKVNEDRQHTSKHQYWGNATTNVPPNTVRALSETIMNELDTKARNTKNGRKPRIIEMVRWRSCISVSNLRFCLNIYKLNE